MTKQRMHLGEILFKAGLVDKQALINAIKTAKSSNKRLGQVLMELGLINEDTLTKAIAKQFGLKYVDLDQVTIPPDARVADALKKAIARRGGRGPDLAGELGVRDVGDDRRVDQPVRQADRHHPRQQHGRPDQTGAGMAGEPGMARHADQDQAGAADNRAPD